MIEEGEVVAVLQNCEWIQVHHNLNPMEIVHQKGKNWIMLCAKLENLNQAIGIKSYWKLKKKILTDGATVDIKKCILEAFLAIIPNFMHEVLNIVVHVLEVRVHEVLEVHVYVVLEVHVYVVPLGQDPELQETETHEVHDVEVQELLIHLLLDPEVL